MKQKAGMTILRDALVVLILITIIALGINALRSKGLPLVAKEKYRILVPCPEPAGEAKALHSEVVTNPLPGDLMVDGRTATEFAVWHPQNAVSVPFDYLTEVNDETLASLVKTGARRVIVFGDGQNPDSGEQLAKELSGRGIKNVHFITGGAPALRKVFAGE